jgi:hypothetical protein
MPGLDPGIHVFAAAERMAWMAGTSSAKTRFALLPGHDRVNQNVGGVQALITSHGLLPMQRKRCGRRLSK